MRFRKILLKKINLRWNLKNEDKPIILRNKRKRF